MGEFVEWLAGNQHTAQWLNWQIDSSQFGKSGSNPTRTASAAILHAYDATNLTTELYDSNQAANGRDHFTDNKFITPMIANGKVYVGTPTGVIVFGLLP